MKTSEWLTKQVTAWIAYLRANPEKQITMRRHSLSAKGYCCALGALELQSKLPLYTLESEFYMTTVLRSLALDEYYMVKWNDYDRLPFPQIANKLEAIAKEQGLI